MKPQQRKKLITIALIGLTLVLTVVAIVTATALSNRKNVNPNNSKAGEATVQWTKVSDITGGSGVRLVALPNNIVAVGVRPNTDTRGGQIYMRKSDGSTWEATKMLPNCSFPTGDSTTESADTSGMSEVVAWNGNFALGSYPKAATIVYDGNGNCINNLEYGIPWGDSTWKGNDMGAVFNPTGDNSRLYYVQNDMGDGSWPAYIKDFTGKPTSGNVFFNRNLTYFGNNSRNTEGERNNDNFAYGAAKGAGGQVMAIVGDQMFVALNEFRVGGGIHKMGPIPNDAQGAITNKFANDNRIQGLPTASVEYIRLSDDKKTIYVGGFYNSGNIGTIYAFDTATNALKGEVKFPAESIPTSITQLGNSLFVGIDATYVPSGWANYPGVSKGVVQCALGANGGIASCGFIEAIPGAQMGIHDVDTFNGAVYAVGSNTDGTGSVYKRVVTGGAEPTSVSQIHQCLKLTYADGSKSKTVGLNETVDMIASIENPTADWGKVVPFNLENSTIAAKIPVTQSAAGNSRMEVDYPDGNANAVRFQLTGSSRSGNIGNYTFKLNTDQLYQIDSNTGQLLTNIQFNAYAGYYPLEHPENCVVNMNITPITPSPSPTVTAEPQATVTPSPSPSPTVTTEPQATVSPSASPTTTVTAAPQATVTPSASPTTTSAAQATVSPSPSEEYVPTDGKSGPTSTPATDLPNTGVDESVLMVIGGVLFIVTGVIALYRRNVWLE